MSKAITGKEAITIFKQSMVGAGTGVTDDEIDTPGTDLNLFAAAVGACVEAVSSQIVKVKQSASILSASDDELDDIAFSLYQLKRQGDTPSIGTLRLSRATDDYGAFTYVKGSRISIPGGIQVETLEDADFGVSDLFIDVPAKSTLAGIDYNIYELNVVTRFIDIPQDSTVTCVNTTKFVGGNNRWSGDRFKQEIINYGSTLAKATLKAIETGAKQVSGISYAKAENNLELVDGVYMPDGQVNLTVSDSNGMSNESIITALPDSLEEYAPAGVYVFIEGGDREWIDIELEVSFVNSLISTSTKKQLIKKSVAAYVNSLGKYEPYSPYECASAIMSVNGVKLTASSFVEPSGVTYPSSSNKIFKTEVSRIKVNGT